MLKQHTQLPNLGRNFHLDFIKVQNFEVSNVSSVTALLEKALKEVNLQVASTHNKIQETGIQINYILNNGFLNYMSFTEQQACVIDLYYTQFPLEKNEENDRSIELKFEDVISEAMNFETNTLNIGFNRGKYTQLQTNELPDKNEIFHNVKFVHKEKTLFQDLRIYDTVDMGRVLILDGMVQISNELEDNYTVDMQSGVVNDKSENILIIGGGDLLIANYILKHYPNVKKVVKCEIDEGVIRNVKKHFTYGQQDIQKALDSGRFEININDGAKFAEEQAKQFSEIYDGIVIDCSDSWNENSPALSLTTVEFYKNLHKLLKKGGGVSQQLSHPSHVPKFKEKWTLAGYGNFKDINCVSPEYGGYLPLGVAYKL